MTPVPILYVIDTLEMGGTERSLLETCARIDRSRFAPRVCSIYEGNLLADEFRSSNIPVSSLEMTGKYQFRQAAAAVRRVIEETQPAMVHSMLFRSGIVSRFALRGMSVRHLTSLVNVPYDPVRFKVNPQHSRWKTELLKQLDRWTARWNTHFHAVSNAVKDSYVRQLAIPESRITVIPRGREAKRVQVSQETRARLRTELGLQSEQRMLLNVGRLVPAKGQLDLIRAMPRILEQHPNVRLLIAGEGHLRDELEREIQSTRSNDHVNLLGQRSDVNDLLGIADCFVFPTRYEGLPGAVIEAMFAGLPIVASDIPMLRDLIVTDENGILVRPGDVDAFADGICNVLADGELANRLGSRASESARRELDIDDVVRRTEQLYEQLVATGSQSIGRCSA